MIITMKGEEGLVIVGGRWASIEGHDDTADWHYHIILLDCQFNERMAERMKLQRMHLGHDQSSPNHVFFAHDV